MGSGFASRRRLCGPPLGLLPAGGADASGSYGTAGGSGRASGGPKAEVTAGSFPMSASTALVLSDTTGAAADADADAGAGADADDAGSGSDSGCRSAPFARLRARLDALPTFSRHCREQ